MSKKFRQKLSERILTVICWLVEQWFDDDTAECDSAMAITRVHFQNERITITGDIKTMQLKESQFVIITAMPKTRSGNQAQIEPGSVRVELTDGDIASFEHPFEGDELKIKVVGEDGSKNGSTLLTLRADGIAGEGEREIIGTLDIVVTQGDAFVFELQASAPTDEATESGEGTSPVAENPGESPGESSENSPAAG
ncbi:MAG: hypothetical protein M3Q99_16865 [Acidobacteriota bacterium]|nr:hypothetical protein [Acidobacteriota bacterium]